MKAVLFEIVERYETDGGISPDQYNERAVYHPMAEGKYLLAIAAMHRAGFLSKDQLREKCDASVARLIKDVELNGNGCYAFGLNFSYKYSTCNDKYVITNCIIAHGLFDIYALGELSSDGRFVLQSVVEWLSYTVPKISCVVKVPSQSGGQDTRVDLPQFSNENPIIVANAVSYWSGIMALASENGMTDKTQEASMVAGWVDTHLIPRIGWVYADKNPRIDLLHQCYIINSLNMVGREKTELSALSVLSNFVTKNAVFDKYDCMSEEEAVRALGCSRKLFARFYDKWSVVCDGSCARIWSIGEALVVCAYFVRSGTHKNAWKNFRWKIVSSLNGAMGADGPTASVQYFRDSMHLAHGIAVNLEADRSE